MGVDTNKITLLIPCYLNDVVKTVFEDFGFNVLYGKAYGQMERLIKLHGNDIDIAIEWQRGPDYFPVRDLFKKYGVRAPIFLALNYYFRVPEDFAQLGFVGYLNVPFDLEEVEVKFRAVVSEEKAGVVS